LVIALIAFELCFHHQGKNFPSPFLPFPRLMAAAIRTVFTVRVVFWMGWQTADRSSGMSMCLAAATLCRAFPFLIHGILRRLL
jgi:hypothetical protein